MHTLRYRRQIKPIVILLALLLSIVSASTLTLAIPGQGLFMKHPGSIQDAALVQMSSHYSTPTLFMHRPYYGSQSVAQRTTSFVDHDKPWYENDGIFVRYDGTKWTNASIGSCTPGVNCYDGHNGYDLNLRYEPVLSAAAGTVVRAGWYNPSNHQSSLGLWAAVDHGNGYLTAYGHLSALTVATGDKIGTQWQVGTSGTTGSSTGPHLHMATYYLPNWNATDPFGWTGTYPDPNVVPDNYLWVNDPGTSYTVPILSGHGNAVYPGATLVDDGDAGWSSTGNWSRDTSSTAIKGNLHWTSTSSGGATATATWQPRLPADGYYEAGVFVTDTHASSSWVPYTVYSADPNNPGTQVTHMVYVDETHIGSFQGPFGWESTGPQWISLGTYYFRTAQLGRVVLSNATGENGAQVSADGAEFVPVSEPAPPTPTPTPTPTPIYGFAVTNDVTPPAMLPNSTTNVNLTLKNTSNFTWKATGTGAVEVLYRWLNAQKQVIATGNPSVLDQDVNPNVSVTVTMPVHTPTQEGSYTLQWDMLQGSKTFSQQGAQVHNDSVEVARYTEVFGPLPLPTTLTPGASIHISVNVQNKGAITWPASGSAPVTLGYYWLDTAGHPLSAAVAGVSSTGTLPNDVAPGQSVSIPITLHTPALAGSYQLVYDLQKQGTWFSSLGGTPLKLAVTITPTLPKVYYFAEGYTGSGTTEYLSLTNPGVSQATVSVTYLYAQGVPQTHTYAVPAQAHSLLNINQEAGANQAVSMIVQSDQPIVAERSMFIHKGSFVAASGSVGSPALSTSWYFAEGNSTFGWDTLLAVMNSAAQPVTIKISYLLGSRTILLPLGTNNGIYTIPARSRSTIVLNNDIPNQQFGMSITASGPVMIERPEYLVMSNLRGGNSVVGATSPQTTWYFAGGNTNPGFNERLILANPGVGLANVQIRYLSVNGQVVSQKVSVPGLSRIEVNVNSVAKWGFHSTVLTASLPIVAERQDFFSANLNGTILGSTTTMGSSTALTSWYLAQGDTTSGYTEYLALANPNNVQAQVQVVYYLPSGAPIVKTYTLAANSRLTVNMLNDVGANKTVGTAIYATVPIVTEQELFFNISGASGGYASTAFGER
ncbi:MAG: peptidoglycan DD-metalloendopeptidase family protein [Ktedonobacteraceae bacterium]